MARVTRTGEERIVPDRSVPGYLDRGWTVAGATEEPEEPKKPRKSKKRS